MEIDLSLIKNQVPKERNKKGKKKAYSPEDMFMMEAVQPASHSAATSNEYFLVTKTEYDGCNCGSELPDSELALTIVPHVNPMCFGFTPPPGWMPNDLGFIQIHLDHSEEIEVDIHDIEAGAHGSRHNGHMAVVEEVRVEEVVVTAAGPGV